MRHSWEQTDENGYKHRCRKCGMGRLKRPHPYARQWFLEFWLGGEFWYGKTPPCQGVPAPASPS